MHALLKEGEETLFTRTLPPARAERLKIIEDGCYRVLVDLQGLVEKYESLGTQTKRTWDRMRWGNEDIAEIRARITSNITILTAFISTSQISVETKLEKFVGEFHQGKKEASIVQTVDSLSADDRAVWRTICKELEEVGISVAAFDANREFIFDWFIRAVETGAFKEQNEDNSDEESNLSDGRESQSSGDNKDQLLTPARDNARAGSVPLGTPPQTQIPIGTQSNEHTPRTGTDKSRKHKSSNSSFFPKISRWSRTTASSVGDNFRNSMDRRQQRPFSEASRSGEDLQQYGTNDHYDHHGDDQDRQDIERQVEHSELERLGNISKDQQLVRTQSLGSAFNTKLMIPKRGPKKSERILAPKRTAPRNRTHAPRVAALLVGTTEFILN